MAATGAPEHEPYIIISSDCHAGLPCEEYRPYLPEKYHAEFDTFLAERAEKRRVAMELNTEYISKWEGDNEEGLKGAYDTTQRDKELDADGIACEVMFADADAVTGAESPPFGAGLSAGMIEDAELAFAGAHAHNLWLAELCAENPSRRAGVGLVPICHDIGRALDEIAWLAGKPGIRGIMIPTMWRDKLPYGHADYDAVWARCEEAHLVVHTHSGEAPFEEYENHLGSYVHEVPFWTERPVWHMLYSGVFDRFPGLKYSVAECGAYWLPDLLWKADVNFGGGHTNIKQKALFTGQIGRLPSEYWGVNCFIGASTMSKEEIRRRHAIGTDVVMWGSDYPHPEGTWPNTRSRLKKDFANVPVEDARKMLGLTAARVYEIDVEPLRDLAARIAPTPAELGQDVGLQTDPAERRDARWWLDEYHVEFYG